MGPHSPGLSFGAEIHTEKQGALPSPAEEPGWRRSSLASPPSFHHVQEGQFGYEACSPDKTGQDLGSRASKLQVPFPSWPRGARAGLGLAGNQAQLSCNSAPHWGPWAALAAGLPMPAGLRAAWAGLRGGRPRPGPWWKGNKCGGDALCPEPGCHWEDSALGGLPLGVCRLSTTPPLAAQFLAVGCGVGGWAGILRARTSGTLARGLSR